MRALTLYQPFAWAVAYLDKGEENRRSLPPLEIGETFAVHGGIRFDVFALRNIIQETGVRPSNCLLPGVRDATARGVLTVGAVQAVARLEGWVRMRVLKDGCREVLGYSSNLTPLRAQHAACSRWAFGPYLWLLADRMPLAIPVLCSGAQGPWKLPPDVEAAVRRQIGGEVAHG